MIFDHPHFYRDEEIFVPIIYDAGPGESIPASFNTARIALDGRMRTHLDWKPAIQQAKTYRQQGFKLFWDLDLGLFSRLPLSFSNETQFRSLALSVDHFLNDLWPQFMDDTLALNLYRGSADFSQGFPWCHQQQDTFQNWLQGRSDSAWLRRLYCRGVSIQYLEYLAGGFPATLQPMLMLDAHFLGSPAEAAQLLSREKLARFLIATRGGLLPSRELAWEGERTEIGFIGRTLRNQQTSEPRLGICIHPDHMTSSLSHTIEELVKKKTPFRILSETYLTSEWDGLDEIIIDNLSPEGHRKLQGFAAAGGVIKVMSGL